MTYYKLSRLIVLVLLGALIYVFAHFMGAELAIAVVAVILFGDLMNQVEKK